MGAQQAVHVLAVFDGQTAAVGAGERRLDVRLPLRQLGIEACAKVRAIRGFRVDCEAVEDLLDTDALAAHVLA